MVTRAPSLTVRLADHVDQGVLTVRLADHVDQGVGFTQNTITPRGEIVLCLQRERTHSMFTRMQALPKDRLQLILWQ